MRLLAMVLVLSLFIGCAAHKKEVRTQPELSESEVKQEKEYKQGSLWQSGQSGLFEENKAREVGDILTVAIFEQASATREAQTTTGRDSSISAGIPNFFGLESEVVAQIQEDNPNIAIDPSQLVQASYENEFEGSGATSREEQLSATLTTQVVDILPTGNLRICGSKRVTVNNEDQFIRLSGTVRPSDINAQNVVNSKFILDAEIEYTGKGVISDKQKPGWLIRLMDNVWPF